MTGSPNSSSGCLSGIARLLLCKGSLQTHPSDQITEPTTTQFDLVKKDLERSDLKLVEAPAGNPGVVARLMGLDSLPDTNWVPKGRAPDSVTRSRSVNFMDYLLQLDLTQAQHRRVRTSVSFREVPTSLNHQNHDFLLLYLDNDAERNRKMACKMRNSDEVSIGAKQRSNNEGKIKNKEDRREDGVMKKEKNQGNKIKISNLEGERGRLSDHKQSSRFGSCKGAQVSLGIVSPRKKHVNRKSGENSKAKSPVKPVDQKEVLVESKFMKKMKNRHQPINDLKPEHSRSEDSSSPVSVLGLDVHGHETPLSYEKGSTDLNSKKMISSPKTKNFDYPSSHPAAILNKNNYHVEQKEKKENDYGYGSFENGKKEYYIELVRKVCKLTEEDIKESNWIAKNGIFELEYFDEEILMDFGQQILDLLLCQVVEEMAFCRDNAHGKFSNSRFFKRSVVL